MNLLALSSDPVALDATMCRLFNLDPGLVPTTRFGMESGAGTLREDEIELLGDPFASFYTADFDIKHSVLPAYRPGGFMKALNNALVPKPFIKTAGCTRCGTCVKVCPVNPKAVDWPDGDRSVPPAYRYERCIRCYCCQELCPEKAIELKVPFIRRLFGGKAH
jgi:ferredoxin